KIVLMPMLIVWSCTGRTRSFQPLACPCRAPRDRSPTAVISSAPRLERPRVRCEASGPPPLEPRYVSPVEDESVYRTFRLRCDPGRLGRSSSPAQGAPLVRKKDPRHRTD